MKKIINDTNDTLIWLIVALWMILLFVLWHLYFPNFFGSSELKDWYNSVQYDDWDKYEWNIVNNQRSWQ